MLDLLLQWAYTIYIEKTSPNSKAQWEKGF
jgi:hypothetical protein